MSGGAAPAPGARCLNCAAPLAGRFCSQCGQPADVHVPTTHEVLHEALEGLTHFDSRLWRTLAALWFRPGRLTLEFIRGRRMAYLPPFRLYLIVSVVFFLLAASSNGTLELISFEMNDQGQTHINTEHTLREADCAEFSLFRESHPTWYQRIQHGCLAASRDSGHNWRHQAVSLLPKAMFVFVPLVALLHGLLYWRPRHPYVEHLVFFLHLHAFFFSVLTLIGLLSRLGSLVPALHGLVTLLFPPLQLSLFVYLLWALKRVFARSWPLTVLKAAALFMAYSVLLANTMSVVFIYAALQL